MAGLQAPAGPQGKQGVPGPSMLSQTIPSGTTVRGGIGIAGYNAGPVGTVYTTYIDLPLPTTQELHDSDFMSAPSSGYANPNDACSGSRLNPTAPPGKVCLYSSNSLQVASVTGSQQAGPMSPTYPPPETRRTPRRVGVTDRQ